MRNIRRKISCLMLAAVFLTGCGTVYQRVPTQTPTLDRNDPEFTISMDEFRFSPDHIRLVVGQNVTIHIVNNGEEEHEIMIGRNTIRDASGQLEDGFEHDFFSLTTVSVEGDAQVMGMNGEDMDMEMGTPDTMDMETPDTMDMGTPDSMDMGTPDTMDMGTPDSMDMGTPNAMDMGTPDSMDMDVHEEAMHGGMVMLEAKSEATIKFTVTEGMEGAWTIGCFEGETPRHYDLGMAGILYVLNFND